MSVSRQRRGSRVLLALAIGCALLGGVGKAQHAAYTHTVIADVTNCFNVGSPAINNRGEVAFGASCGSPIGSGAPIVLRGDGGALTTIFDATQTHAPLSDVISINDSGVVAFAVNGGCVNGGGSGIRKGDGGPTEIVYDICTDGGFTSVIRPSISNTGAVAFMAASGNSYDHVIRANNGAFVTIAGPGTATASGPLMSAYEPAINNNDVVAFSGNFQDTGAGALFTGAGGALTTVALSPLSVFYGLNDRGRVAFLGQPGAIQTGDGGPLTTIAETSPTGFLSFVGGGAGINTAGTVAFAASVSSGFGVFTGPDLDADAVLKPGDVVPGLGTVTSVISAEEAINDSGQVAMGVRYNDAEGNPKVAIIRADPPNHPPVASDDSFSVAAGESFSDTLTATDPDADPITYSIVTNGAKGTAILDDPSTGAFTYTANADASGNDTFTFTVTDSRGLESNVATITIAVEAVSSCAVDVTPFVTLVRARTSRSSEIQNIALQNVSSSPIPGPVSLALDSLTAGVTLVNAAGVTTCAAPAGVPYVNLDLGTDAVWSPGERVEVVLEFVRESTAKGKKPAITYTSRVLAGAGER